MHVYITISIKLLQFLFIMKQNKFKIIKDYFHILAHPILQIQRTLINFSCQNISYTDTVRSCIWFSFKKVTGVQ